MSKWGVTRQVVLEAFRNDPGATIKELTEATGVCFQSVYYHLCKLDEQGAIKRRKGSGNHTGRYQFKLPMETISEIRRRAAVDRIKQKAGQAGRGAGAFVNKSRKDPGLDARIDEVVMKAKKRDEQSTSGQLVAAGVDVIRINRSVWHVRGTRLG